MHVEVGPNPVAGAVQIVESDLPEGRAGERVEAVPLEFGWEDGLGQADVTFQHTREALSLMI